MNELIYVLAISSTMIGLFGFTWAPYRAFQSLSALLKKHLSIVNWLIGFGSAILVYFWFKAFYKLIFKCFMGLHCSASAQGEVLILFEFTLVLLAYESMLFLIRFLQKKFTI